MQKTYENSERVYDAVLQKLHKAGFEVTGLKSKKVSNKFSGQQTLIVDIEVTVPLSKITTKE